MDALYRQRTTYPKQKEQNIKWYVVDASQYTLGRLSSKVATRLQGKHRVDYQPSVFQPDGFVIINAEKVQVTGKKYEQKKYYSHSGYFGGLKTHTFADYIETQPEKIILKAIKGMLPKNKLSRRALTKVRVFKGSEYNIQTESAEPIKL